VPVLIGPDYPDPKEAAGNNPENRQDKKMDQRSAEAAVKRQADPANEETKARPGDQAKPAAGPKSQENPAQGSRVVPR
jgi:hypothetical protein